MQASRMASAVRGIQPEYRLDTTTAATAAARAHAVSARKFCSEDDKAPLSREGALSIGITLMKLKS